MRVVENGYFSLHEGGRGFESLRVVRPVAQRIEHLRSVFVCYRMNRFEWRIDRILRG